MPDAPTSTRDGETAGLALSVGQAGIATRAVIAAVVFLTSVILAAAGVTIGRAAPAIAILLILPMAIIGLVTSAFIAAPLSRFGISLDRFVPRLRERTIALTTFAALVLVSFLVQWSLR